jgi:hypothetical protein
MVMSVCGTDGVTMMAKTLPSVVLAPSAFDGTNHIHTYRSRFIPEGLAAFYDIHGKKIEGPNLM